ncbi:hypothetical protein XTPLMG728_3535 [Xanthomonas translucens pv. poae]|uniref:DUF2894 domain-containing protein n=3 Tax=Xanthomonas translucens group TaxID=3390202 RepID=A0A0K3A793_9XANT|nr:DUF2894 domain-containing protein [Xanthomonas translucens]UKE61244.1 DUF2894 domain-containing protein [Xanthomonas translucens pv. poae]CTP93137.1 hypothetical protein XTPLMG728_3535 [Xanthomonas translucens pv. poae]
MRDNATSASELLGTWRQQHAERLDPLRLRFIEALARRADAHQGEARRLLEQKLSALLDAYAADLARMSAATAAAAAADADADADAAPNATASARSPLGDLLQRFASGATHDAHAAANAMPPQPAQLPALDDARRLWTELRSRSQLRQSLQQAPADAGPLNSGVLVHRALALMRSLSPGYLQQFLAYVDALSWLQQLHDAGALATPHKPDAAIGKKPTRGKPRKRG